MMTTAELEALNALAFSLPPPDCNRTRKDCEQPGGPNRYQIHTKVCGGID